MGMVTEGNLMTQMVKKRVQKTDLVSKVGMMVMLVASRIILI